MTTTPSRELWIEIPEIDDDLLMIETNDAGGPPVLWLERHNDPEPWVFNWGTGRYERAARVIIK
jgi:hypothetical protein